MVTDKHDRTDRLRYSDDPLIREAPEFVQRHERLLPGWKLLGKIGQVLGRWFGPYTALVLFTSIGLGIMLGCVAIAEEIYDSLDNPRDGITALDRPILHRMQELRTPALNRAVTVFTNLGDIVGMTVIALIITGILTIVYRRRTPLLLMLITALGSVAFTVLGKNLIGRPRPAHADAVPPYEGGFSFPSGHSLNSLALYGMIAYLVLILIRQWWLKILIVLGCLAFAACMGLSRIYLGQHWTTDVLTAWLVAIAWIIVVITGHRIFLAVAAARSRRQPGADGHAAG